MQLRLTSFIRHLNLSPLSVLQFTVEDARPIKVELGYGSWEWVKVEYAASEAGTFTTSVPQSFCQATYEREPPPRVLPMLRDLAEHRLPHGSMLPPGGTPPYIQEGLVIKTDSVASVDLNVLPPPLQTFINEVARDLTTAATCVIKLVRWRYDLPAPHRPVVYPLIEWSENGEHWHPIPAPATSVPLQPFSPPGWEMQPVLTDLLNEGATEPLGHELYREAWHQRHSNPRSALLVAIAAAEIHCKQCITSLAPDTSWLLGHLQSPRLVDLIWGYLPQLAPRFRGEGALLLPPTEKNGKPTGKLYSALMKGVKIRNDVVHTEASPPKTSTVQQVLEAVADLLWVLDYYGGRTWALQHVSETTLREWGASEA